MLVVACTTEHGYRPKKMPNALKGPDTFLQFYRQLSVVNAEKDAKRLMNTSDDDLT